MSTAKIDALIKCACAARAVAIRDENKPPHQQRLFASQEGAELVLAAFDLFECDELYQLYLNVIREIPQATESPHPGSLAVLTDHGSEASVVPLPRVTTDVRKLDPAIWGDAA